MAVYRIVVEVEFVEETRKGNSPVNYIHEFHNLMADGVDKGIIEDWYIKESTLLIARQLGIQGVRPEENKEA